MQDSLRFLVQDSLTSFTQMVVDACCSIVMIADNFTWGSDLIFSPFRSVLEGRVARRQHVPNAPPHALGAVNSPLYRPGIVHAGAM